MSEELVSAMYEAVYEVKSRGEKVVRAVKQCQICKKETHLYYFERGKRPICSDCIIKRLERAYEAFKAKYGTKCKNLEGV
jgi:hypothetical protein